MRDQIRDIVNEYRTALDCIRGLSDTNTNARRVITLWYARSLATLNPSESELGTAFELLPESALLPIVHWLLALVANEPEKNATLCRIRRVAQRVSDAEPKVAN